MSTILDLSKYEWIHKRYNIVNDLNLNSVPILPDNLYFERIGKYRMVYNPVSYKAPVVLSNLALKILKLVDKRRNIEEIQSLLHRDGSHLDVIAMINAFRELSFAHLVFFVGQNRLKIENNFDKEAITIWWHLTNQCNLSCKYCYVRKSSKKMSLETANVALEAVFRTAVNNRIKRVHINFGGGEPLLEFPLVIRVINRAKVLAAKSNISVSFSVLTNGTLITDKIASDLKYYSLGVGISLDGIGGFHNGNRPFLAGNGSYDFVKRGIDRLRSRGVEFSVLCVITRNNINGIPSLTKYFLDKDIIFSFAVVRKNKESKENIEIENDQFIDMVKRVFRIISRNPPRFNLTNVFNNFNITQPGARMGKCYVNGNYFLIRHDGKLTSCQMTLDTPIGSIADGDLLAVARGVQPPSQFDKTVDHIKPCFSCQWKYACSGGCSALNYYVNGKYDSVSPMCQLNKQLIPMILRLDAQKLIFHSKNRPFFLLTSSPYNKIYG